MRPSAVLIVYTFISHLLGWKVYFWTDQVYGSSCQWCGLDLGNCQTRITDNLAPSLTNVTLFRNIFYFVELTSTWLLSFSHKTPCPEPSKKGSARDWSLAVPTIFITMHTRDGGKLPDQVPRLPSSRDWFFPYSDASSDISGLAQINERLDSCVIVTVLPNEEEVKTSYFQPLFIATWISS